MMRLKHSDYVLLTRILDFLNNHTGRSDLSIPLGELLKEYEAQRDKTRADNRRRAKANREAGYVWPSSSHPTRSKYFQEEDKDNDD